VDQDDCLLKLEVPEIVYSLECRIPATPYLVLDGGMATSAAQQSESGVMSLNSQAAAQIAYGVPGILCGIWQKRAPVKPGGIVSDKRD
jgi:hypothetical protein